MKRASGFSIIEVMIGLAVLSFAASVMMIFSSNLSDNVTRSNIDGDAQRLMANIQHLLNMSGDPLDGSPTNPACSTALRQGAGRVVWTPLTVAEANVTAIMQGGTVLAAPGMNISPSLQIKRIYLREPNPVPAAGATVAEGTPVRSRIPVAGSPTHYYSYVAKLVVEFTVLNSRISIACTGGGNCGGGIPAKTADVVVAIDPATDEVAFCVNTQPITLSHVDCTGAPGCGAQPRVDCTKFEAPTGFNSSGVPVCMCQWVCPTVKYEYHWERVNNVPTAAIECDRPRSALDGNSKCVADGTSAHQCIDMTDGLNSACGPTAIPTPLPTGMCYGYRCVITP